MKSWLNELTDEEIRWFLKKEVGAKAVENIRRQPREDNIILDVTTDWIGDDGKPFDISDTYILTPDNVICDQYDNGEDIGEKWQKFLIALKIHPLQLNNPYKKIAERFLEKERDDERV